MEPTLVLALRPLYQVKNRTMIKIALTKTAGELRALMLPQNLRADTWARGSHIHIHTGAHWATLPGSVGERSHFLDHFPLSDEGNRTCLQGSKAKAGNEAHSRPHLVKTSELGFPCIRFVGESD